MIQPTRTKEKYTWNESYWILEENPIFVRVSNYKDGGSESLSKVQYGRLISPGKWLQQSQQSHLTKIRQLIARLYPTTLTFHYLQFLIENYIYIFHSLPNILSKWSKTINSFIMDWNPSAFSILSPWWINWLISGSKTIYIWCWICRYITCFDAICRFQDSALRKLGKRNFILI